MEEPLHREARIRRAEESLADCGGVASVFFFFVFFSSLVYFLFLFLLLCPPPPAPHTPRFSSFQGEASPLHLLADWPRRHRKHPLTAEEEVSFIASVLLCVYARARVCFFPPDLRALQNPIKRSSICRVHAGPFSGRQRAPERRRPILTMLSFFLFFFSKPLDGRDSCVLIPG